MTAHVDLSTGKIHGCKRGSFKWWHEKGHLEFGKSPKGSTLLLLKGYIFYWMITTAIFSLVSKFIGGEAALIFWAAYTILIIYEEHWCNEYAKRKLYKP